MSFNPSLDEIFSVLEFIGCSPKYRGGRIKALCPCHDDKTPSLDIDDRSGATVWICRAGCSQTQITAKLIDGFNRRFGKSSPSPSPSPSPAPKKPAKQNESEKGLWPDLAAAWRAYDAAPLAREHKAALAMFARDYGFSAEHIPPEWRVAAGAYGGLGILYPGETIEGERVLWWRGINRTGAKKKRPSYPAANGARCNHGVVVSRANGTLIVVCGQEKGQSAALSGYSVFSYFGGEHNFSDEKARAVLNLNAGKIITANDNDTPGREANKKIAEQLIKVGTAPEMIYPIKWKRESEEDEYDLSDAFKEGGAIGVHALLEGAPPFQPNEAPEQDEAPEEWPPAPKWDELPPADVWPWEALPEPLDRLAAECSEVLSVPAEMANMAVLGVASIAARKHAEIEIKPGHVQGSNLYILIAAPVGAGKTPLLKKLQAPLLERQRRLREQYDFEKKRYDTEAAIIADKRRGLGDALRQATKSGKECELVRIESDIRALDGEQGDPPVPPCTFLNDATPEAIARRMAEGDGFNGVLTSEGRRVLEIARGRYSSSGSDIAMWLCGHAGDYLRIDRQGRQEPMEILRPIISATLMTQRDSLQHLGEAEELRDSGFLARWLYVVPDRLPTKYSLLDVSEYAATEYGRTIERLLDMTGPRLFRLSDAARKHWMEFHDRIHLELSERPDAFSEFLASWLVKLPENCARIALISHLAAGNQSDIIDVPTMINALKIGVFLKKHAERAEVLMGGSAEVSKARAVWNWIESHRAELAEMRAAENAGPIEAVKSRDIIRGNVASIKSASDAKTILQELEERALIKPLRVAIGAKKQNMWLIRPEGV